MAKTLTEDIYDRLRHDILTLRLMPGQKVSEAKLARHFDVSRAPVRNVLQKLQEEGLVIVKPQIGTIIMPISLKQAKDILEVRLLLEPHTTRIAAGRATDDDLADLDRAFAALDDDTSSPEERAASLFATDAFLHQKIWHVAGNDEVVRILNDYQSALQRIRRATYEMANRMAPSIDEMHAIVAALRAHDGAAAEAAMHLHISNILHSMEEVIAKAKGI